MQGSVNAMPDFTIDLTWPLTLTWASYPSGRVAITITSLEQGLYTYILQEDSDSGQVVGIFQPDGYAMTNYQHGSVR